MKKHFKSALAIILALVMILSVAPISVFAISLDQSKLGDDMFLTSKTDYTVAPGITETQIMINNKAGNNQQNGYAMQIDLNNPTTGIYASYKNMDPSTWGMQSVRDQALVAEKKRGVNVVGGVNGDYFNMGTGAPTGTFVMQGTTYNVNNSWNYFAILKDGTPVIGKGYIDTSTVQECIGGPAVILKNGKIDSGAYSSYGVDQLPRTAVGITADKQVVLFVTDGRQAPAYCGMNFVQLAYAMLSLGCVDALAVDGGGSTTYVSQHEGSEELVCRNSPSDGSERTVSTALLVYSTAKPTGEFDHASLTPNNDIFTPGSSVELSAVGVDSAGSAAPLPSNAVYALADESFGSVSGNVFTSNGKIGQVVVNYVVDGVVCGSTEFGIREPDALAFEKEEINLAFDQVSDLGLIATYEGRKMICKAGDFIWDLEDSKMGTFDGNTFTASPDVSVNGTITVTSSYNSAVSANIYAVIGRQPYVVWDFENPEDYSFATGYLNANGGLATYLTGDSSCTMLLGSYVNGDGTPRGAKGDAEVVDVDNGEVRLGSHALKISYDFTNQPESSIDGVCIGSYSPTEQMIGKPTAIGVWVYAPEGTPNFWFRIRYWDAGANSGKGAVITENFTVRGDSKPADGVGGINWQGWKYCEAPLTGVGPFSLLGGECIRFMNCVNYSQNGNKTVTGETNPDGTLAYKDVSRADRKGVVYIDNVQFVYGSNTQDIDNPVIDSITVGNASTGEEKEIVGDVAISTNDVVLQAKFHDVQNKYTTGIDYENNAYRVYVDGVNVTESNNCIVLPGDDVIKYYATLADGVHSIKLMIRDGFGNETTETRYFTVNGGVEYPTVQVVAMDESCVLNQPYRIALTTNAAEYIDSVSTVIKLDADIVASDSQISVSYAEGFDGSYTYDSAKGLLVLQAAKTGVAADASVATVSFAVPWNVAQGKSFSYRVTEGSIVYTDDSIVTNSFSTAEVAVPVTADYIVSFDPIVVGSAGANIYVADANGNAAAGVNLYRANGALLGVTVADGAYFSADFVAAAQGFTVYASDGAQYSFMTSEQSYIAAGNADGSPAYIISDATENAASSKKLSWISDPVNSAASAYVQYTEKDVYLADGEAAFSLAEGVSTIYCYDGSSVENNRAARINSVKITGLKEGAEYAYRCGDGAVWSDVSYFTTNVAGTDTSFFIVGDIQAEDMTVANRVFNKIASDGVDYAFGIQTGDAIETSNIYTLWQDVLDIYSADQMKNTDLVHVYGNHELIGDPTALSSKLMYGLNDVENKYYSVEYGNVYVAVINFQETYTQEEFLEALEWLEADAGASKCNWKILSIHSPVYNTNLDAYIAWEYEYLPTCVQNAGIDAVFSGHDHSYSRTFPMTDGNVDEENGVVYFICGNVGEKSYSTVVKPEYNFASFTNRAEYDGIYLSVSTTDAEMTVTAYNVVGDEARIVDTYTFGNTDDCIVNGHDYTYNPETDTYKCKVCGYRTTGLSYTGFVTDELTGKNIYLHLGEVKTNAWLTVDSDVYYLDENGYAVTGKYTVTESLKLARVLTDYSGPEFLFNGEPTPIEYSFGEDGKLLQGTVISKNGAKYCIYAGVIQFGWYQIDGDWYMFDGVKKKDMYGKMLTGVWERNYKKYECDSEGRLIKGAVTENQGTKYYWADDYVTGWQTVDGLYFNSNRTLKGLRYFDPETGYMVVNATLVIDGAEHTFDENGVCNCSECKGDLKNMNFIERIIYFFNMILSLLAQIFGKAK